MRWSTWPQDSRLIATSLSTQAFKTQTKSKRTVSKLQSTEVIAIHPRFSKWVSYYLFIHSAFNIYSVSSKCQPLSWVLSIKTKTTLQALNKHWTLTTPSNNCFISVLSLNLPTSPYLTQGIENSDYDVLWLFQDHKSSHQGYIWAIFQSHLSTMPPHSTVSEDYMHVTHTYSMCEHIYSVCTHILYVCALPLVMYPQCITLICTICMMLHSKWANFSIKVDNFSSLKMLGE